MHKVLVKQESLRKLVDLVGSIYCVTCSANGKKYIGQTTKKVSRRVKRHFSAAKWAERNNKLNRHPFFRAILAYGEEAFSFVILEEQIPIAWLDEVERYWIGRVGSMLPHGYNATSGGETKKVYSQETRDKISVALKGRARDPEASKKSADKLRGTKKSPEHCQRMSEYWLANPREFSAETRKKMSDSRKGRCYFDEAAKAAASERMKLRNSDPEYNANRQAALISWNSETKVRAMYAKHLITGEVVVFKSRRECAKYFNRSDGQITDSIKRNRSSFQKVWKLFDGLPLEQ